MSVNTYYLLLSVLFSLISIATFILVATFSKKLTIVSLISTVLGIVSFNFALFFSEIGAKQFWNQDVSFWTFLIGMVYLTVNIVFAYFAVLVHDKRNKLIFSAKQEYLNRYFCLKACKDRKILFNVKIKHILRNKNNKAKRKDVCKSIRHEEHPTFILYIDGKDVEIKLDKKEIFYKDKLVGYAYIGSYDILLKILTGFDKFDENNLLNKSVIRFFDLSFDMSKETVMYFDFNLDLYVLSDSMAELLQEKDNYLSSLKYQEKIVSSDLAIYLKREFNSEFINKYEYRVKTEKGILKFEELIFKDVDTNYDIVRISSRAHTDVNYLTRLNLIEDIKRNYFENLEFALIIMELKTVAKISGYDKQLADLLTKSFFLLLKDQYLQNKVYKLEKNQYAFLLNKDEAMRIKTDLENNCSMLTSMEIMLDDDKILIENTVSFIYGNEIEEKTADNLINIGLNEIYITGDTSEEKAYSIYKSPIKEGSYKYEDMVIDLNDDDLKEFL